MIEVIKTVFDSTNNVALLISALSTLIAAISTLIAFESNRRSQKQYKESIKPQLSMKLVDYDNHLFLQIKNTGKMIARETRITPLDIKNNGDNDNDPNTDGLFSINFELYPEEIVQSEVGMCYQTISESAFPQLELLVEYSIDGVNKNVKYYRTVTFAPAYDTKIIADINVDKTEIENSLKSISKASVRTANYLDGRQVAEFDSINITAGQTLRNDLKHALGKEEDPVMTREETLKEQLSKGVKRNG